MTNFRESRGEFPEVLRQRAVRMIKSFLGLWFLISQYHFLKQKAIILSVRTATPAKILRLFTAAQYQKNLKNPRFPEKMHKISQIFHFSACMILYSYPGFNLLPLTIIIKERVLEAIGLAIAS